MTNFVGTANLTTGEGMSEGLDYKIRSMLLKVNTCVPVQVLLVKGGGVAPVGYINCKIIVNQLSADGTVIENATLYNVPYLRYQGGTNAVIIDPKAGDIGLVCFCQRDISAVKNARKEAPPSSLRAFSLSDGVYVGGILNGTPNQYIEFSNGGITIHSPAKVTVNANAIEMNAPTTTINSPSITLNGSITATGGVSMDGITFASHVHNETDSVTSAPRNP